MTEPQEPSAADPLAAFERERGRLFGIAYRMLGSVSEAEDVLQDAWLRWHGVEHGTVENPSAYLVSLVTRLSIDTLGAARNRLTDYVGPWLPEPLVGRAAAPYEDPAVLQERVDDLSIAFLLLLERLTPVERAVFLLRESFDFSYREIAGIVGKTEENCRQIDRRARKRLEEGRRPVPVDPQEHDRLLHGFLSALKDGDLEGMVSLLARDATLYSDGGGKARAALKPVPGGDSVARFLLGIRRQAPPDWEVRLAQVNGQPGFLNLIGGHLLSVVSFRAEEGLIREIYIVLNPDKLGRVEVKDSSS
jgi:RNA polymerase sigma-70 factor (ECF subfamily)